MHPANAEYNPYCKHIYKKYYYNIFYLYRNYKNKNEFILYANNKSLKLKFTIFEI